MLPPRRFDGPPVPPTQQNPDAAVRSTDSDALLSRASAHQLGYLQDSFSTLFLTPTQRRSPERRPPLINIGTHARTFAVDELVEQFLLQAGQGDGRCQVLSLGAGTDTRFWRMRKRWEDEKDRVGEWRCKRWVEVDFPEATGAKARTVSTKAELKGALGGAVKIDQGGLGLSSPLYGLLPGDLRSLPSLADSLLSSTSAQSVPSASDSTPLLDPSLPTLLLLECVIIYLQPEVTDNVLSWFSETFGGATGSAVVSYDPFGLEDQFGTVMKRNLAARNLSLPGAASTPTLSSLIERLRRNGIKGECGALSVKEIREEVVPRKERERIAKIEQIDEVEELNLVLSHYAVAWGNLSEGVSGIGLDKRN
ncbi:hypothetical protein JCM11251_003323 [Rhodosporidiobolus azoricus]